MYNIIYNNNDMDYLFGIQLWAHSRPAAFYHLRANLVARMSPSITPKSLNTK